MMGKAYLVWCNEDNLMDFDDRGEMDYVLAVCSTEEKAKEYIKNWKPVIKPGQSIVDSPSEVESEHGFKRVLLPGAERIIYIHAKETWERTLCTLAIDEREMDE